MGMGGLSQFLEGPSVAVWGGDGVAELAKEISAQVKKLKKPEIKGGAVDGIVIGPDQVEDITKLPSREALIGRVVGLALAPAQRIVALANAPAAGLLGQLKTLAEGAAGRRGEAEPEADGRRGPGRRGLSRRPTRPRSTPVNPHRRADASIARPHCIPRSQSDPARSTHPDDSTSQERT